MVAMPSDRFVILTVAGKDRPGILSKFSRILYELECNIEDTSMTRLRGEFAMMLIAKIPGKITIEKVHRSLGKIQSSMGLSLLIKPIGTQEASRKPRSAGRPYTLSVGGIDQPGIISRVTDLMKPFGINITNIQGRVIGSAAKPSYIMDLEVDIQPKVDIQKLNSQLQKIKKEMSLNITLHLLKPV